MPTCVPGSNLLHDLAGIAGQVETTGVRCCQRPAQSRRPPALYGIHCNCMEEVNGGDYALEEQ